jgi:hypothetical protein
VVSYFLRYFSSTSTEQISPDSAGSFKVSIRLALLFLLLTLHQATPGSRMQPGIRSIAGHTDTVPDIVGRIGTPASLVIFTEGNHLMVLLSEDIVGALVPEMIARGYADVGITQYHLISYWTRIFPNHFELVPIAGAERFFVKIALGRIIDPLRPRALKAFEEFFFSRARDVYPRYDLARMSDEEYGAPLALD